MQIRVSGSVSLSFSLSWHNKRSQLSNNKHREHPPTIPSTLFMDIERPSCPSIYVREHVMGGNTDFLFSNKLGMKTVLTSVLLVNALIKIKKYGRGFCWGLAQRVITKVCIPSQALRTSSVLVTSPISRKDGQTPASRFYLLFVLKG